MRRFALPLVAVLLLAVAPGPDGENSPSDAGGTETCPASRLSAAHLPRLRAALAKGEPVVVVAVGSSSTQGWMASDSAHTYPAVLQAELSEALPHDHIAVLNRGIGGQDAAEEVARLDADVVAVHPQLVIWQVGANSAMKNVDPALFRRLVTAGVKRLHGAGADVILMDSQRAPRILAAAEHVIIEELLGQVAAETGASLFSRGALMDAWRAEGAPYAAFIASDGLHHNDHGYHCIADALAGSIAAGLSQDSPRS